MRNQSASLRVLPKVLSENTKSNGALPISVLRSYSHFHWA